MCVREFDEQSWWWLLWTREGNSLQPSNQGKKKERNWSSTRPIYNMFLYFPFVMSGIFEGLFAKHFTCMNSLNPSNALGGVYCERPHLNMWEKRSSGRWNSHQGNWKICGYPHLPPHSVSSLLFVLREYGTYKNRETQELAISRIKCHWSQKELKSCLS